MPFEYPGSGQGNVAEFMMSPLPFVTQSTAATSSTTRVDFPYVTSHWVLRNTSGNTLFVGFTVSGTLGGNRFTIASNTTLGPIPMRIKTMYLVASGGNATFDIMAGLTLIQTRSFPILTGSSPIALNITGTTYDPYLSYAGLG